MKKYIKVIFIFIIISSFFCGLKLYNTNIKVSAENATIYNNIDGIVDEYLFKALYKIRYYDAETQPDDRPLNYIPSDAFKDFEELDLSGYNIESLMGLNLLDLSNLKTIDLSNNKLQTINEDVVNALKDVETLNLSYNNFNYLDLSGLNNTSNINLSYNSISEINLKNLPENTNINLMSNNISSTNNLTIDENKIYNINLSFNKLETIEENLNSCNIDYYFQNTLNTQITTNSNIKILSGYSMPSFNIKVFNSNLELVKTINILEQTSLPVGNYYLKFYNSDTPLYDGENNLTFAYRDIQLKVVPQRVSVKYFIDNEEVEYSLFNKNVTLKFFAEENAKILVSVNGKEFVEESELTITEENRNTVIAKCVIDNIESENTIINVTIKKPLPLPTSLLFFLSALVFIALLVFFRFYANKPVNFNGKKDTNEENS